MNRRALITGAAALAAAPIVPKVDGFAPWASAFDQWAEEPQMDRGELLGAFLHARRLGLRRADLDGLIVVARDPVPGDTLRLNFIGNGYHCSVSATACHLHWFDPGAVDFDRFGNAIFNQAAGR